MLEAALEEDQFLSPVNLDEIAALDIWVQALFIKTTSLLITMPC